MDNETQRMYCPVSNRLGTVGPALPAGRMRMNWDDGTAGYCDPAHLIATEALPDFGDHMTLADFKACVDSGLFTDDDGTGYYATDTLMVRQDVDLSNINEYFTHVVWFNK